MGKLRSWSSTALIGPFILSSCPLQKPLSFCFSLHLVFLISLFLTVPPSFPPVTSLPLSLFLLLLCPSLSRWGRVVLEAQHLMGDSICLDLQRWADTWWAHSFTSTKDSFSDDSIFSPSRKLRLWDCIVSPKQWAINAARACNFDLIPDFCEITHTSTLSLKKKQDYKFRKTTVKCSNTILVCKITLNCQYKLKLTSQRFFFYHFK